VTLRSQPASGLAAPATSDSWSARLGSVPTAEPTAGESAFFAELAGHVPGIQDWYHQDEGGSLWMVASYDFVRGNGIYATLRLDYDGKGPTLQPTTGPRAPGHAAGLLVMPSKMVVRLWWKVSSALRWAPSMTSRATVG
jgi:hypothetical protein